MVEEKNKNQKKEGCPLCNVSEETLRELKKAGKIKKADKKSIKNI